jgi:hypothetical protein
MGSARLTILKNCTLASAVIHQISSSQSARTHKNHQLRPHVRAMGFARLNPFYGLALAITSSHEGCGVMTSDKNAMKLLTFGLPRRLSGQSAVM